MHRFLNIKLWHSSMILRVESQKPFWLPGHGADCWHWGHLQEPFVRSSYRCCTIMRYEWIWHQHKIFMTYPRKMMKYEWISAGKLCFGLIELKRRSVSVQIPSQTATLLRLLRLVPNTMAGPLNAKNSWKTIHAVRVHMMTGSNMILDDLICILAAYICILHTFPMLITTCKHNYWQFQWILPDSVYKVAFTDLIFSARCVCSNCLLHLHGFGLVPRPRAIRLTMFEALAELDILSAFGIALFQVKQ